MDYYVYADLDMVYTMYAKHTQTNPYTQSEKLHLIEVKYTIDLIEDSSGGLFSQVSDQGQPVVVYVASNDCSTEEISALIEYNHPGILCITKKQFNAELKKKHKPKELVIKLTESDHQSWLSEFLASKQIRLPAKGIKQLLSLASVSSRAQAVQVLSILSDDPKASEEYLSMICKEESLPIFMKRVYEDQQKNKSIWYPTIVSGEEQLILSLLLTKTHKLSRQWQNQSIPKLILADRLSKTVTGLSATNAVKIGLIQ